MNFLLKRASSWRASVRHVRELHYDEGANEGLDRPRHVRAGSAVAKVDSTLLIVQDDANFLALVDLETGATKSVALPAGEDGLRQFDDARGNKKLKWDLEACVYLEERNALLSFGSGSTPYRNVVVILRDVLGAQPRIELVRATALYEAFRADKRFSGSELNIEGVVRVADEHFRFFQRGNGAPDGAVSPVDATCDVRIDSIFDEPELSNVRTYELGDIEGVRLTFTDAARLDDSKSIAFLAAAEASPDAYRDGEVVGTAIGIIDETGAGKWTPILDASGRVFRSKVEGLARAGRADEFYVVVDADSPGSPSLLCEVLLEKTE